MTKTEKFIQKAKDKHGNTFTYDNVDYVNQKTKVKITCPKHGDFEQTPKSHLSGTGCRKCFTEKSAKTRAFTTEDFIKQAQEVHRNYYNYSKTEYVNKRTKVTITCPVHGDIQIIPGNHIHSRSGCSACKATRVGKIQLKTTEQFIKEANRLHNNLYTYEKAEYTGSFNFLRITCKHHGYFRQQPSSHLQGHGCPTCTKSTGWSYSDWEKAGERSRRFDSFKLYVIECWDDKEAFIKVGKTYTSVGQRFSGSSTMPYKWKLLKTEEGSAKYISELEHKLHKRYGKNRYEPTKGFRGASECFNIDIKDLIKGV